MGKTVEGIKVAAKVAEIIMAGSIVVELVSKWNERRKLKAATSVETATDKTAETDQASWVMRKRRTRL